MTQMTKYSIHKQNNKDLRQTPNLLDIHFHFQILITNLVRLTFDNNSLNPNSLDII